VQDEGGGTNHRRMISQPGAKDSQRGQGRRQSPVLQPFSDLFDQPRTSFENATPKNQATGVESVNQAGRPGA
jgi:hypothetical protein